MRKVARKNIFECHVGSKLYGTNRPDSDEDLMGVFLPSTEESFGLVPFSRENSEHDLGEKKSTGERNTQGDLDRKFYRLDKFLGMLAEGQSKQLEMLFSPKHLWTITSPEWELLLSHKDLFLSKNAVTPFCQFAKAQSLKAVLKGENLNTFREFLELLSKKAQSKTLKSECYSELLEMQSLGKLKLLTLDDGVEGMELAGKKYLLAQKVKDVKSKMSKLEKQYGTRSQGAAESGYDFRSLCHAYRLLFQAEQMLKEHKLEFPLPAEQVNFLKSVRLGEYKGDYFTELEEKKAYVESLVPLSTLPDTVDLKKVDELCQEMLVSHLLGLK